MFGRGAEPQVPEDLPGGPPAPRGLEPAPRVTLHDPGETLVVAHHVAPFEESVPSQPGERSLRLRRRRRKRHGRRFAGVAAPPKPPDGGEEDQDSQREQADRSPPRGYVQFERSPDVMDVSLCRFGLGRQRRDDPHRRGRRLDERELAVRGPDTDRHGRDLVVAGEHEGAQPEAEPALAGGSAIQLERDRPQHPEVAEVLLDDRCGLRTLGVLDDYFQLEDVPDLHRFGDDFGNGAGGRSRSGLAAAGGGGRRHQAQGARSPEARASSPPPLPHAEELAQGRVVGLSRRDLDHIHTRLPKGPGRRRAGLQRTVAEGVPDPPVRGVQPHGDSGLGVLELDEPDVRERVLAGRR